MPKEYQISHLSSRDSYLSQYPALSEHEQKIARVWYLRGAFKQQEILTEKLKADFDRLQEACKVMEEAIRDVKNESLKYGLKNSHRNEQIGSLCDEALAKAKEILEGK